MVANSLSVFGVWMTGDLIPSYTLAPPVRQGYLDDLQHFRHIHALAGIEAELLNDGLLVQFILCFLSVFNRKVVAQGFQTGTAGQLLENGFNDQRLGSIAVGTRGVAGGLVSPFDIPVLARLLITLEGFDVGIPQSEGGNDTAESGFVIKQYNAVAAGISLAMAGDGPISHILHKNEGKRFV